MEMQQKIETRLENERNKLYKIQSKIGNATPRSHASLTNLTNQEEELKTDIRVFEFIESLDLGNPELTENEKESLYHDYSRAIKHRNQIRKDIYQSEKSKEKKQQAIKKATEELNVLITSNDESPKNVQKIREKKEKIEYLKLEQKHDAMRMADAEINYAFSKKIISDAGTDPGMMRLLSTKIDRLNNAIEKQKDLQIEFKKNEKASLEARLLLIKNGIEKKDLPNVSARPLDINDKRNEDKNILAYVKHERRKVDSENDYLFSRKILANAEATGETRGLEVQFNCLNQAIEKRNAYKYKLEGIENKQLTLNNELGELKRKIRKIEIIPENEKTESNRKDLAEYYGQEEMLNLKIKQEARKATDARQLHDFSNALIDDARTNKNGDASKLPGLLQELEVAEERQEKYRDRLNNIEKTLSNKKIKIAKQLGSPTGEDVLLVKQLTRKKEDAELAHAMITDLIDQAARKKDPSGLKDQCQDLRQGINATRKYRRLLKEAENKYQKTKNAESDYLIAKRFLLKAQTDRDPTALPDQFKKMETAVAERNKFTKRLEKEEEKKYERDGKISNAERQVFELKEKFEFATKELNDIVDKTDPKFIKQQSVVNKAKNAVQVQELKLTQLRRKEKQNAARNKRRLENAIAHEDEANRLLNIILDPNEADDTVEAAKQAFEELKQKVQDEKNKEEELAPKDRRAERKEYRKNLEAAEKKELNFNKKQSELQAEQSNLDNNIRNLNLVDTIKAQNKLTAKKARLDAQESQIAREEEDTKLIYDFSDKLLQESANDESGDKAAELENQFKGLRTANQLQRETRKEIEAVDKKLNSAPKKRKGKQLKRQKEDLMFGHKHMQKLISDAYEKDPLDLVELAKQCEALREGIGGNRRNMKTTFGQAINREALEKYENEHSTNKLTLKKSEDEKNKAEITKIEHPNRYKKAFEKWEDDTLLREQSKRKRDDARNDYKIGQELLEAAVADTPDNPSKSDRIAALKDQFSVLQAAIQERNKFTKRLEEIKKAAKKTERQDIKNLSNAEKKKTSIEKNLNAATRKLAALNAITPPNQDAIDKQQSRVDELQEAFDNQSFKVKNLEEKATKNAKAYTKLVEEAEELHAEANKAVKEAKGKTNQETAIQKFAILHTKADAADDTEKARTVKQKSDYELEEKAKEARNANVRQGKADVRQEKAKQRKEAEKEAAEQRKKDEADAKADAKKAAKGDAPGKPAVLPAASTVAPTVSTASPAVTPAPPTVSITLPAAAPAVPTAASSTATTTPISPKASQPKKTKTKKAVKKKKQTPNAAGKKEETPLPKGPFTIECALVSTNPEPNLKAIVEDAGYTLESSGNDFIIKKTNGTPIGKLSKSNDGKMMTFVSEAKLPEDKKSMTEIAARFATEKNGQVRHEPEVITPLASRKKDVLDIFKSFYEKHQAQAAASLAPQNSQKSVSTNANLPSNSITVPVHTSKIAQAQALYELAQLTNCTLEPSSKPGEEGKLLLKDKNSKMPKAEITFYNDADGKRQMTATFKAKPVERKYIEQLAIFAAHNQPNDRNLESKQWHHNFTEESAGASLAQLDVDKVFSEKYETMKKEKNMTMMGTAISRENEIISQKTPEQQKQDVLEMVQKEAGLGSAQHNTR